MNDRRAGRRLFGLGLALLVACASKPDETRIAIRDATVNVEIADTLDQQRRGLGGREDLPWDTGMLFVYEKPAPVAIWMKGMQFDIDIVWIQEGRIVDMVWGARHDVPDPLPVYRPRQTADRVLEVPAGYAEAHGWLIGDSVTTKR